MFPHYICSLNLLGEVLTAQMTYITTTLDEYRMLINPSTM